MALCSLSTGRMATPHRRAASVTSAPAITSTSLFASAIVFRASIAARTASSPAVPADAQITISTSGWVATASSPSGPATTVVAADPSVDRRRSIPAAVAIAATAGRYRSICSASSEALSPAASAATCSREGCASTTASALRPIDPVEPRIARRFTARHLPPRQMPASRRAARRSDPGRHRGLESETSCPSRSPRVSAATRTGRPGCRARP